MVDENKTPVDGIYFSFLNANGINHRLASNQPNLHDINASSSSESPKPPLVLFLHGFPDSWYTWRHQLTFLRDKPFLAVAPDMRGYGSTSKPSSVDQYTLPVLAKDVTEIASALGYEQFLVVGHD